MKRFSTLFIGLGLLLICGLSKAQQDVMFTQYMMNPMVINPAYTGSYDAVNTTFLYKKQWVKIDGAPSSTTFSAHSPIIDKMGAGIQVSTDNIGITNETNVTGTYSYTLPVNFMGPFESGKLALGLSAGVTLFKNAYSNLNLDDATDIQFSQGDINGTKPQFGFGTYYYTEDLYLGVSVPRLISNTFNGSSDSSAYKQSRHFYIAGGYVLDITKDWKFKPNFLIRSVSGAPVSVDLNANFLFIERLWLGVSFRVKESLDFLAQFNINEQLRVGYAYDLTTGQIGDYTSGSHEFMVNYLFDFNKYNYKSPRYF
jgi:type IX secretion system PorP/SprF family membrane protein